MRQFFRNLYSGLRSANIVTDEQDEPQEVGLGGIAPLHQYDRIYLAGQPSETDFGLLSGVGIKHVLNVRTEREEWPFDERAVLDCLGMVHHHVPFLWPRELTDKVIEKCRAVIRSTKDEGLVIHCGEASRVGAIWIAYRVLDMGKGLGQAVAEARKIGLKSWRHERIVCQYVRREH